MRSARHAPATPRPTAGWRVRIASPGHCRCDRAPCAAVAHAATFDCPHILMSSRRWRCVLRDAAMLVDRDDPCGTLNESAGLTFCRREGRGEGGHHNMSLE